MATETYWLLPDGLMKTELAVRMYYCKEDCLLTQWTSGHIPK